MKKHLAVLMLGLLPLGCLTSCNKGEATSSSSATSSSEKEMAEDSIYVGLYAKNAYLPDIEGGFESKSSDTSLLDYQEGYVLTYGKEGVGSITFASESKTLILSVSITKDSTLLPSLTLLHSEISVYKDTSYELPFTLTYGGRDLTSYANAIQVSKENGDGEADITAKDSKLNVKGTTLGSATYTISTEFLGFLISKQLTVTVKEDDSFFVYGERMSYDDEGPKYVIKMYGYADDPLVLSNDLKASYKGQSVPYSSLKVSLAENDFATIEEDGTVSISKAGTADLVVTYLENSLTIRLSCYKEIVQRYALELENRDFSLEKEVAVDKNKSTRVYSNPSSDVIKSIAIPEAYGNYKAVSSLSLDGSQINAKEPSYLTYDVMNRALKIDSRLFDASIYGVKSLSLVLESEYYMAQFDFELLFITKTITTFSDFSKYIAQAYRSDTIQGYFVLGNDIDALGASAPGSWTTSGWDFSAGFRGTLDGRGFAIKNMKTGEYGISGIIGSGALIQNIDFVNLTYVSSSSDGKTQYALFSRGMKGVTLRHINITLSKDSITDVGNAGAGKSLGFFTIEKAEACQFEYVKVDATGFDMLTLVGKQADNTVYSDCELICKSLKYVYAGVSISSVSGIKLINA